MLKSNKWDTSAMSTPLCGANIQERMCKGHSLGLDWTLFILSSRFLFSLPGLLEMKVSRISLYFVCLKVVVKKLQLSQQDD